MFNRLIIVQIVALAVTALVFGLWPQLDLAAARAFVGEDGLFVGATTPGIVLRGVLYALPLALGGALLLIWLYARWRTPRWRVPSSGDMVFMIVCLALGPGLLVNGILKEHSHRPRPFHTAEVNKGGQSPFRPWYRFDGECGTNCSFVSGEASAAAWTLAPALVAPVPVRAAAIAGSILLTLVTGLWRMALGGHYASDVLMGALLTSLLVCGVYRLMRAGLRGPSP